MSYRGGFNSGRGRGGVSNQYIGRGGAPKQENTWVEEFYPGPRGECQYCNQLVEEKQTKSNPPKTYWVCKPCNVAGGFKKFQQAASNSYQAPQNNYQASTPLQFTPTTGPPTGPTYPTQTFPGSSCQNDSTNQEQLLEEILAEQRNTTQAVNTLINMMDGYIAAKGVSYQELAVMEEKAQKEAEVPVITEETKSKFINMGKRQRKD